MDLLIVDASSTVRRTIRNTLTRAGITDIVEAEAGQQALAFLDRETIPVLIVGAALDDMAGTELAARVRKLAAYRRTPLLMVSEKRSPEDVLTAVDAGVDDYILFPFPDELLVEKVQKALEKAAQLAAALAANRRGQIRRHYKTPRG